MPVHIRREEGWMARDLKESGQSVLTTHVCIHQLYIDTHKLLCSHWAHGRSQLIVASPDGSQKRESLMKQTSPNILLICHIGKGI